MLNEVFALEIVDFMLLKVELVGQTDDLQSTQEQAEQSLIEDLLVFGELVFHNGVYEQDDALFEHLLLVAEVVLRRGSWARMAGWLAELSRLDELSRVERRAELSPTEPLG